MHKKHWITVTVMEMTDNIIYLFMKQTLSSMYNLNKTIITKIKKEKYPQKNTMCVPSDVAENLIGNKKNSISYFFFFTVFSNSLVQIVHSRERLVHKCVYDVISHFHKAVPARRKQIIDHTEVFQTLLFRDVAVPSEWEVNNKKNNCVLYLYKIGVVLLYFVASEIILHILTFIQKKIQNKTFLLFLSSGGTATS